MVAGMGSNDLFFLSAALLFNTFTAPAVKITQTEGGASAATLFFSPTPAYQDLRPTLLVCFLNNPSNICQPWP